MSNQFKIILYVLLVIIAGISGYYALTNFGRLMDRAGNRNAELEQIEPEKKPEEPSVETTPTPSTQTNSARPTEPLSTNVAAVSNALSLLTNQGPADATNINAFATTTNQAPEISTITEVTTAAGSATKQTGKPPGGGRIGLWTALFIISIIGLGFLI